ncbi:hypothetical protein XENOCAPTIV_010813 [Xenoophorus captivus]|uniref:Cullin N-terminal domain-containing protein n=1 Tax=Xenoophorus captivus TaxID=1517983 RepID=A0ABV0R0P3_9TELE
MSCGRTKTEVTDVLSPNAIEEVIKKFKNGGNPLHFSLHTDASNKGNRKMFPLANWVPLKSYLISIGEDCPRHLKALLRLTEDADGVEQEADIVEVYLLFCNNVMSLFEEEVKMLEKNVTTSVDLYSIMDSFLRRLIQRRDDGFYRYLTRQKLQRLSPSDADVARQEFTAFLNTAISYIQKWFDFSEENWLFLLQPLSLASGNISFDDMEKITKRLRLVGR